MNQDTLLLVGSVPFDSTQEVAGSFADHLASVAAVKRLCGHAHA